MVADLPGPAQRYLLHAISPGTPLATSVRFTMTGSFSTKPGADWMPLSAEQILAPPLGFLWKAAIKKGIISFSGADYYANNRGLTLFRLWNLIPIVNSKGPDIDKAAAGRLAVESIWMPPALLPFSGAKWEAIDDESAKAILTINGNPFEITLFINPNGSLRKISTPRWGNQTDDHTYAFIPFGGEIAQEHTFGGYTIPSNISVGWWFSTNRYYEFFRATITNAEFR